jgi:quercetin dioxygenase-like cupin family protein
MRLSLYDFHTGAETLGGQRVVYDVANDTAAYGAAHVEGHALVWQLDDSPEKAEGALLSHRIQLDPFGEWIIRCDRIDFPPGGIAHRHVHPGPGIRRLLHGELTIDAEGAERVIRPGDAWFEGADYPVLATASASEDTAFVRVLLLPREWEGKRTIRYLDPADEAKPKLQRATVLLEEPLAL